MLNDLVIKFLEFLQHFDQVGFIDQVHSHLCVLLIQRLANHRLEIAQVSQRDTAACQAEVGGVGAAAAAADGAAMETDQAAVKTAAAADGAGTAPDTFGGSCVVRASFPRRSNNLGLPSSKNLDSLTWSRNCAAVTPAALVASCHLRPCSQAICMQTTSQICISQCTHHSALASGAAGSMKVSKVAMSCTLLQYGVPVAHTTRHACAPSSAEPTKQQSAERHGSGGYGVHQQQAQEDITDTTNDGNHDGNHSSIRGKSGEARQERLSKQDRQRDHRLCSTPLPTAQKLVAFRRK